jgi:hypothetical protein
MSNLSVQLILEEAEKLTRIEKIELIDSLGQHLPKESPEIESQSENLADFLQRSPLVGVDIDLSRSGFTDNREVEL